MPARTALQNPVLTRQISTQASSKLKEGQVPKLEEGQVPKLEEGQVRRSQPIQNRVAVLLVHIPRLSICGQARLAAEAGVSRSTISRLVSGKINPSYRLARGVTSVLERMLGYPLDMRDVFSTDGTYLTPSGCGLCKCGGCLPEEAYDAEGNLCPEWQGRKPGDWSMTPMAISISATADTHSATAGSILANGGPAGSGKEGR